MLNGSHNAEFMVYDVDPEGQTVKVDRTIYNYFSRLK